MYEIYYFTGTGNSLQIATDLKNELKEAKIIELAKYKKKEITCDAMVVVFPVYNWGAPLIIRKFLKHMAVGKDTLIYAIADFGGLPGKALDLCKADLEKRNLALAGGYLIQMPGNYIIGYGAISEKLQAKLFEKEKTKIVKIAEEIKSGKTGTFEKSHLVIDRAFYQHFYKDVKNFPEKDKNYIVSDACIGCSICEKRCPVGNIKIKSGKPVWQHHCELCMSCIQSCPKQAINYGTKTDGRARYINPNVNLS